MMMKASIISFRLISYLFVVALSISSAKANVDDSTPELDPIERTLHIRNMYMARDDESLGPFDRIIVNLGVYNGRVRRMNCLWPNVEIYSPRLSRSEALRILDERVPKSNYRENESYFLYIDKDDSIPHLTTDSPQPRPFTVEDFPWQLDPLVTNIAKEMRYEAEEIIPFQRTLYIDTDFKINILFRVEGRVLEGQIVVRKDDFTIEAFTRRTRRENSSNYYAYNSRRVETVLRG